MPERIAMGDVIIRRGKPADVEPAVTVWLAATAARREGLKLVTVFAVPYAVSSPVLVTLESDHPSPVP